MNLKEFFETNTITKCNICSNKIKESLGGSIKQCTNEPFLNKSPSPHSPKFHFFIYSMKYGSGEILEYYFMNKIENIEIFYKEFYNIDGELLDSFIFNGNNIIHFNNEYVIDQYFDQCKEKATSLKLEFCHDNILSEKSIEKLKTLYLFG